MTPPDSGRTGTERRTSFIAPPADGARGLQHVLRERARTTPDATAALFLSYPDGRERPEFLSYGRLDRRAGAIAARLLERAEPGDRILLAHDPGLAFVEAFFGCLYAGLAAVPLAPSQARDPARMAAVAKDAGARLLLVTGAQIARASPPEDSRLTVLDSESLAETDGRAFLDTHPDRDPLAFLQYTSGTTGAPKGVMVRQSSLLANLEQICAAFEIDARAAGVSWLPHYHDMGLIGGILTPIYTGYPVALMSPLSFLQHPIRWLRAIHHYGRRYGEMICGGPSFAYQHCVERVPEELRSGLDLSCWRIAFCGAEPVRAEALGRFSETFAANGFRASSFYPCYGMAEATLFLSGGPPGLGARVGDFDAAALERGLARLHDPAAASAPRRLVGCGVPCRGTEIRIVDDRGREVPEGRVGEIWASGPGIASGYWGRDEATRETFAATLPQAPGRAFLRTGDLGFLQEGELFISGRTKDLIIIAGRNIAPQDLEWTAQASHPAVVQAAAFPVPLAGTEGAAMVAEIERRGTSADFGEISAAIRRAVAAAHDVPLAALALVRPGLLPRTTSGKLARGQCQRAYAEGRLSLLHRWQPGIAATGTGTALPETPWLLRRAPHPGPALRLFCFPYGGGSASAYARWFRHFGEDVEVCPILLPGWESRLTEEPIRRIAPLLELFEDLAPKQAGIPFAFFGFCLGAHLAYAVARHLRRKGLPGPASLIVAAKHAPSRRPRPAVPTHRLDDQAFLDFSLRLMQLPSAILDKPDALRRTLHLLRASAEVDETMAFAEGPPLDCPITVIGGREDWWVPIEDLVPWIEASTGPFTLQMVDGPHNFFYQQQDAILAQVTHQLALLKASRDGTAARGDASGTPA
ncbi:AMP-binding protein [Inquilinus limosus]|uniref:AMP-binding protein n=1 Tax=Inquilinus limosus TaxID=171674 RepID=UPI000419515B|nr:AMP-binding protein [Inquilinus limosus]